MSEQKDTNSASGVASELNDGLCGAITMATISAPLIESGTPIAYRLLRKRTGEVVLQGCYAWQRGWSEGGTTWRDIPTEIEVPDNASLSRQGGRDDL